MIANKPTFAKGMVLMVSFAIVFVLIFMPIFGNGKNGLVYLDDLYNSISKGSAYYIPKLQEEIKPFEGKSVTMTLEMDTAARAAQTAKLFEASDARVSLTGQKLKVQGDLGKILDNCLDDADLMYVNDGPKVKAKYGLDERLALYNWWLAAKLMDKDLKKQKLFKEASAVTNVQKRGLETSYNYYTIQPEKISAKWGIVLFSLVFYVIYTMWYGFAIMFLFEGWGLRLEH
jgi:hypothetical protein